MTFEPDGPIVAAAEPDQPGGAGEALALPPNLDDLCEGRNRAIALWLEAYDTLHANMEAAASASIGGKIGLHAGHDRYGRDIITPAFLATGPTTIRGARYASSVDESDARTDFAALITKEVDRRCWDHMMKVLGFDALLDRQAREEFNASLENDPPHFTAENCRATFGTIWGSRRDMYLRGIANTFMKMDRRFRSHDAFAIGNRLIIERAFGADSAWWVSDDRRDTLHDVERIFRELDGKGPIDLQYGVTYRRPGEPAPPEPEGIVGRVVNARQGHSFPMLVRNDYFRVRVFQNGNLHLWFEQKVLLKNVNELLLEYYRPVEGDVGEGPSYEAGPLYHQTPARNYGLFPSPPAVVDALIARVECLESRQECNGRWRDEWVPLHVLEPSAGTGAIAKAVKAKGHRVTCVEIQPGLAFELRNVHGFPDTIEADFLKMKPEPIYDAVVMNPPFDRGRDCDHVRHAFQFLKPGGVLVAVMSARAEHCTDARHQPLHDLVTQCGERTRWAWRDLPERSFAPAGTNVNTVTLRLQKPR